MSIPQSITFVRHAESAFNRHKQEWKKSSLYQQFIDEYNRDWQSDKAKDLAIKVAKEFASFNTDHSTDLTDEGRENALCCGEKLSQEISLPDVVIVSPYLRTRKTFELMCQTWPELAKVDVALDERIREREFGLRLLYGDWRAMNVCHPEQRALYAIQGSYWYRQPQGESIPDVRERIRRWTESLNADYANKNVLVITHHVSILCFKANHEHLSPEDFVASYHKLTPHHCSITKYQQDSDDASTLKLVQFNQKCT